MQSILRKVIITLSLIGISLLSCSKSKENKNVVSAIIPDKQLKTNMITVDELIDTEDSAWPIIENLLKRAKNKCEVLSTDKTRAREELYKAQVSTHSTMGSIIYETGGILINNGWIRLLGSGNPKLDRALMQWNKGKSYEQDGEKPTFLLVADDILGGFFAINGGEFGNNMGKIYYFAPDTLVWEDLGLSYSDFVNWLITGDIQQFYAPFFWTNWEKDVSSLDGNQAMSFYPYLSSKEGSDINNVSKKAVPIEEIYQFTVGSNLSEKTSVK